MVEFVESAAERKERKRLKKLAKLAALESSATANDDSPISSDVESGAEKKERKRLKKLAKIAALEASSNLEESPVSSDVDSLSKKEKKRKKDKNKNNNNEEIVDGKSIKESSSKKSKKRKGEDWNTLVEEEEAANQKENATTPKNAWMKIVQQKFDKKNSKSEVLSEEPPVKKKKKKEVEKVKVEEIVKEKGTFRKIFYKPTEATKAMPEDEVVKFRDEHKMIMTGNGTEMYKPVKSFNDFCLDPKIMSVCKDFSTPTPIQAQCWPIIASGRDIIGIAETGSGKTLAFSLPAIAHMLHRYDNPVPGIPANPIMLVLSPTRELAMQTQVVMEQAGKECQIRSVCCYGGVPKWDQKRALRWGVEVVVATPGRLKDLVNMGCVSLAGISYLVLDEADRMLDQGFEDDIRQIIGMTHKERQTCLFSATWPEAIRNLAREFLTDPVKVTMGSDDLSANKKIKQVVEVIDERDKTDKLMKVLQNYTNSETKNRMIIFVLKKAEAYDLEDELWHKGLKVCSIHGDKSQWEREQALKQFKDGTVNLLVATDVAARGLDIPDVEYVINYSFPLTIEDYVHRIGRTGRAGKDGVAHSFFHRGDARNAGCLVKVLKDAGQEVPQEMYKFDLRIKASTFNKFFNKDGESEAPKQCFKCGDTGHMSRFCGQGGGGGGRGGGSSGGDGCFKCGESGHFSRECPKSGGGGRGRGRGRGKW